MSVSAVSLAIGTVCVTNSGRYSSSILTSSRGWLVGCRLEYRYLILMVLDLTSNLLNLNLIESVVSHNNKISSSYYNLVSEHDSQMTQDRYERCSDCSTCAHKRSESEIVEKIGTREGEIEAKEEPFEYRGAELPMLQESSTKSSPDRSDDEEVAEIDVAELSIAADAQTTTSGTKKKKKKPKKKSKTKQTEPPTLGLSKLFPSGIYPKGQDLPYNDNLKRTTDEETRAQEREKTQEQDYNDLRRAAEVHRQVRHYARKTIKPGMTMTHIADLIENGTRALVEENGMLSGVGFPTGLSLDHCAAHYTPNPKDNIVLASDNVMKVDFGVHVNGRIVDSAFTMTFDPVYDALLEAVKAATETGVRTAGIDVVLAEVGEAIQETMESYEVEIKGKTFPVKSIRNLNGHNINPYSIHGGKSVPIVKPNEADKDYFQRMEEGETFAIETFGSTGEGYVHGVGNCSHYAMNPFDYKTNAYCQSAYREISKYSAAKRLFHSIEKNFGTLPFCRRYLDRIGEDSHLLGLSRLVKAGIVQDYPPLNDIDGCYTAQFEHTILLKPTSKEVVSRGDDY